ncbi:cytochrome P450 [Wolfiporia cocos MD-104 SS10]|uniref:Cytochrome P450 n=1 Tax=Wolfiporia cocos (strain MD-104) TaxID=742152 RepID=A0A2H3JZ53_WOLCO|nr:cytochrome P450 [Wolfiporia cocos MD-104 SS10]
MAFLSTISLTFICLLVIRWILSQLNGRLRGPLPPGPPGLPIIGNTLQLPREQAWLTYAAWAKVYGDIIHVSTFGQSNIILNSPVVITDLLEKRAAAYSDRPIIQMAGELAGYSQFVMLSPSGKRHREGRSLLLRAMNSQKALSYHHIYESKIALFLPRLLETPENFRLHIRWLIASIVFQISHGYQVKEYDDHLLQLAEQVNHEFSEAMAPGVFLVDAIPLLRLVPSWFPGAGFKKQAMEWRQTVKIMNTEPYEYVRNELAKGTAIPSFASALIEQNTNITKEREDLYRCVSSIFYTGLPHKVMQEDEYKGYRIPAGSTVWANIWSISLRQWVCCTIHNYIRTLLNFSQKDPRSFAFGFGKRTCPGRNVAEDTLFLLIATVLATCDISKAIDHNGVPIEPEVDYTGMICTAGPFVCRIAARTTEAEQLVKASALAT